jgi:hypothetical protein
MEHLLNSIRRVKFLETTLFVDCDRGEVSVDVTRDGKVYLEGPLGIVKGSEALALFGNLGEINGLRLYYHDIDCEEFIC